MKRAIGQGVSLWLLLAVLVGCAAPTPAAPPASFDAGWVLFVQADGPRWLGPAWWRAQGIDPTTLDPALVHLYGAGEPIPTLWKESPQGPGLLFYGVTASQERLGAVGIYELALVSEFKPTFPVYVAPAFPSSTLVQTTTLAEVWLERDLAYRSTAPLTTPWLWEVLRAPEFLTLTVPLTAALASSVTLTLRMWGQSSMQQSPDHHIRVIWNGTEVDDHSWDGAAVEEWTVVAPSARAGDNILVLEAPGDTDAPVDVMWLDAVGVQWTRALRGADLTAGWESWQTTVDNVCWPDTPPQTWQAFYVDATGVVFTDSFRHADAGPLCVTPLLGTRGWLGTPWTAPAPDVVRPRERVTMTDRLAVDYLMVAPASFHAALTPLVEARRAEGLTVAVVTPQQVYDTFGNGLPTGETLRRAVLTLQASGTLRYLLLVGDASADPRAAWDAAAVPTLWRRTEHIGDTPSDYALVADDAGTPLVAVGRFPAATEAEVTSLVEKTLAWQPTDRLLFLNDDEPEFVSLSAALNGASPGGTPLDGGGADARRTLLSWLKDGPGMLVYTGHGSLPMLGDEKLLTLEDAGAWNGPTVIAAWTCLCAGFAHPTYTGLGEAWLRDRRGAVAIVGPTGETTTAEQQAMALAFQTAVAEGAPLGDALLAGWRAATSEDARVSFLLLGDPTLRVF
ncbi:MAG TPA: C25 family cysteine peptidase [Anaerolineae bacterium]|nr:C25 family cysteine peptidase [Anaerolineae bacterium]